MTNLDKEIYIVSDPEGYSIDTLYNKPSNEHDLYICGDLTDSTFLTVGLQPPEMPDEYMNYKTFNLRNIHRVISDDNCYLTFGNRDLNKIKCAFLCELKNDSTNEKIRNYNEGNMKLDETAYDELKNELAQTANPWKEDMTEIWFPFWNQGINKENSNKGCYDTFKKDEYNNAKTYFIDRFNKVFGADCSKGTMAADNLLKTISLELGIINKDKLYNKDKDDFYAFVVLAIYQSMSLKNDVVVSEKSFDKLKELNTSVFNGWLYKLFTRKQSQSIVYREINNKLYLFSHGGLNHDVLINSSVNLNILDNINSDVFKMENIQKQQTQQGGFYLDSKDKDIIKTISKAELYENVNKINEFIKNKINIIYNYNKPIPGSPNPSEKDKRTEQMKAVIPLLILSSGFSSDTFNNSLQKEKEKIKDGISTENISPILANGMFNKLRQSGKMFVVDGVTETIQLIGHSPNGYGSSVDLFEKGTTNVLRTVLINLDVSNSFIGSISSSIGTDNILSKNYCRIDKTNNLYTNATINFKKDISKPKKFDINKNMVEILNPENLTNVFISSVSADKNEFKYSSRIDELYPFIRETYTIINYPSSNDKDKEKQTEKVINYNGRTSDNINIFTLAYNTYLQFNKNLFILNDDDYKKLKTLINCIVSDSKEDYKKLVDLTIKLKNTNATTATNTNINATATTTDTNVLVKNIVNNVEKKLREISKKSIPRLGLLVRSPFGLPGFVFPPSYPRMGLGVMAPQMGIIGRSMSLGVMAPQMSVMRPIGFPMTLPYAPLMSSLYRNDILNSSIPPEKRYKYYGPTVLIGDKNNLNPVNMSAVMSTSLANKYISKNDKVFYNKYMKYKSKYISLKNELNV